MEDIIFIVVVLGVVAFFVIKKIFKTRCTKCRTPFDIKQMLVSASELKWEAKKKTKTEEKNTEGSFSLSGTNYTQITTTNYRIYYRIVTFTFKCPKCGKIKTFNRKVRLYDSSCGHSQSKAEEIALLRSSIVMILGRKFVGDNVIKIKNIDY